MKANVYFRQRLAGILEKTDSGYNFQYNESYLSDHSAKSISLSLPKSKKEFHSKQLFPFFHGLLTEGFATKIQSRKLKIDEKDYFTRLIKTATVDTIGCVIIEEIK
ncbi:MAG: HipA N-terminal domain-containing protein [Candidatus Cloacimonetes bacterium]|nr:HipA N-terminal domain-containing protein [Candidatus Cloacimonadota bacterium]